MNASFGIPLERVVARTRSILFEAPAVEKWLVLGFAAFLAGLVGGLGARPGIQFNYSLTREPWPYDARHFWEGIAGGSIAVFVLLPLILLGLILALALLWVSSRGKFVFLECVVYDRAAIVEPWSHLGRMGDSLFFWRLGFAVVCFLISSVIWGPLFLFTGSLFFWDWNLDLYPLYGLFGVSFLALMIGVVIAYIWLFLEHFVIPIMYLHGLSASDAWRRFLPVFRANWVDFMLYGVVTLIALLAFCLLVVAVGFATCCLGWLVLALPYVSSVLLLPFSVPFRLYGVEFLAQFGPELTLPGSGGRSAASPPATGAT